MKINQLLILLTLVLAVSLYSCKDDEEIELELIDYSYFPSDTGRWVVYEVEEINIDVPSDVYDTVRYQLKEVIESEYIDTIENRPTLRIERYWRESDFMPWEIKDVWVANLTNKTAQKVEENIRYVKLIFPIKENNSWNGNAYNNLGDNDYEITSVDIDENVNDIAFDSVLTVTHDDLTTLVSKEYSVEKYVKNIGLVYKEQIYIKADNFIPGATLEEYQTIATSYTQKVIDYSK